MKLLLQQKDTENTLRPDVTIFTDSEYRILQWDMSGQDTWMDPYKYITEYDTGNNPHPYTGQYRIKQLYFY